MATDTGLKSNPDARNTTVITTDTDTTYTDTTYTNTTTYADTTATYADTADTDTIADPSSSAPSSLSWLVPEPGSFNSILRDHNDTRLYVKPLNWTAQQVSLLGCRFRRIQSPRPRLPSSDTTSDEEDDGRQQGQSSQQQHQLRQHDPYIDRFESASNALGQPECNMGLLGPIDWIFDLYNMCSEGSRTLPLHFGQRVVAQLRIGASYRHPKRHGPSLCVTLDISEIAKHRERSNRRTKSRHKPNEPCETIQQHKLNRIQPQNELEDPYILAVLIALAQRHRNRLQALQYDSDSSIVASLPNMSQAPKIKVFALARSPNGMLYFYTARIPSEFLDRLDMPSRFFPMSEVTIDYQLIRTAPLEDFKATFDRIITRMLASCP